MSQKTKQPDADKKPSSKLPAIFSDSKLNPNTHLLHLSVLRQLTNGRAGTAKVKTRSEVRGGGAKPWVQKGTGRARVGSIRSPLWVGGGISHGPKPRSYKIDLPRKSRNLAIAQALVSKQGELQILKKLPEIPNGKTKNLVSAIQSMNIKEKPILIVSTADEPNCSELKRAANNIPYVEVKEVSIVGVFDILKANSILITEKALSVLEDRISKVVKGKKAS